MDKGGKVQIGIVVRDLEPMVEFYGGFLGMQQVDDVVRPGRVIKRFVLGDGGIKLSKFDEAPREKSADGGAAAGVAGLRYITIEVEDVAETTERWAALGGTVIRPVFDAGDFPVSIIADPDGNWVELIPPY